MIGSTVYLFDVNRRKYPPPPKGVLRVGGPPIWREHWRPERIVAETSRSWITEHGAKIPKRGADPKAYLFSAEEVERAAWVHEHARRIAEVIYRVTDYEKLKAVADLVGYQPGENA